VIISRASANGLREIASVEADAAAVVAMAREGRLMLVERVDKATRATGNIRALTAVSLWTGSVLASGPPASSGAVGFPELRWMALLSIAWMVVLLTYLLRKPPDAFELPRGVALAEPGRRFAASIVDWGLASLLASALLGMSPIAVFTVIGATVLPGGAAAIFVAWIFVLAMTTVFEGLLGWSPGKLLLGCRVVSVGAEPRVLGLRRAGARALFKWTIVPWAAAGLASSEGRHRGDVAAGAIVATAAADEPA
ncbi:MAG: RDD family protein, partial [Planctomycetota bacterium]